MTEEKLNTINDALDHIKQGMVEVKLAEQAGIDVSKQKKQLEDSRSRLDQIKNVYYPGQP